MAGKEDPLAEHLRKVAYRAASFASAFGASEEAKLAGLLHDLGKYGDLFQARLAGKERGIDHWSPGAWQALMKYKMNGLASALAIQGHHIGLQRAEKEALAQLNPERAEQYHFVGLRLSDPDGNKLIQRFEADGLMLPHFEFSLYDGLKAPPAAAMIDVRMLYSVLVDADFMETEAHFKGEYRESGLSLSPKDLLGTLMEYIAELRRKSQAADNVNQLRSDLLEACLTAAEIPQGVFTLTAPTGAGKTLIMLAFALKHASLNHLRRIIIVIPYLSIIDQTAAVYKKIFGKDAILEHHSLTGMRMSKVGPETRFEDMDDEDSRMIRLLAENWDAPIIVTTSVQFFESLFSNRPSACRKLHNIAGSVLLFDEVQTFPVSLTIPTLATLSRLAEKYRTTIVFSTATQPAFSALDEPVKRYCTTGWKTKEIVSSHLGLFKRAKRTSVEWPENPNRPMLWQELVGKLSVCDQVLCIVNLKRHALHILDDLIATGIADIFHLSTNMCPAHRQIVLEEVRQRLEKGQPCRLVSTQCVEAGVDVDFPSVFRALGPLDAIAQAAGRCNRNGNRNVGQVLIFAPEDENYPDGAYRQAAITTRMLLKQFGPRGMDIQNPALFETYYRELYKLTEPGLQKMDIQEAIQRQDFVELANLYRIIPHDAVNVLVPYKQDEFNELIDEIHKTGLTRHWINRARPYSISIFRPRRDACIWQNIERIPVGKEGEADDWFIYLKAEHYDNLKGLVPSSAMECLIG